MTCVHRRRRKRKERRRERKEGKKERERKEIVKREVKEKLNPYFGHSKQRYTTTRLSRKKLLREGKKKIETERDGVKENVEKIKEKKRKMQTYRNRKRDGQIESEREVDR